MNIRWKTRKECISEYISSLRKTNKYNTGFIFFDNFVKDSRIITIVGAPGSGKTLLKDQFCGELLKYGYYWLDFQLEMPIPEIIKRELIYNDSITDKEKRKEYLEKTKDINHFMVDEVVNVAQIENLISDFITMYEINGSSKKLLVSIDHALIVSGMDNGKRLDELMKSMVNVKKKTDAMIVILSQLNREIDIEGRTKQGSIQNYITRKDIYMSDALVQYSDMVLALDNPYERGILEYGPTRELIEKNDIIIRHIKNRMGICSMYKYKLKNLKYYYISEITRDEYKKEEININNNEVKKVADYNDIIQNNDLIDF